MGCLSFHFDFVEKSLHIEISRLHVDTLEMEAYAVLFYFISPARLL